MTRSARALCTFYGAATLLLTQTAVQAAIDGRIWATLAFAAASGAPLLALIRESDFLEWDKETAASIERAARVRDREDAKSIRTTADALGHACCEQWWTSLGTRHAASCATPRRTA
ncbi:hypothetical protein [Streptomyces sp. NPDC094468]|uniref:hypothetical protein n=1 Tax=Streptomyces sp. NPDC094468 TaxID=3366066 RepID=UPI0037F60953